MSKSTRFGAWVIAIAATAAVCPSCHEKELGRGLGAACDDSTPCRNPYVCDYGRCKSVCTIDADCAGGACVQSAAEANAWVCTVPSEQGCSATGCPSGLYCGVDNLCRTGCDANHPCKDEKLCVAQVCFDKVPEGLDAGVDGAEAGVQDAAEEEGGDAQADAVEERDAQDEADAAEEDSSTGGTGGSDAGEDADASAGAGATGGVGGSGGQDASADVGLDDVASGDSAGTGGTGGGCTLIYQESFDGPIWDESFWTDTSNVAIVNGRFTGIAASDAGWTDWLLTSKQQLGTSGNLTVQLTAGNSVGGDQSAHRVPFLALVDTTDYYTYAVVDDLSQARWPGQSAYNQFPYARSAPSAVHTLVWNQSGVSASVDSHTAFQNMGFDLIYGAHYTPGVGTTFGGPHPAYTSDFKVVLQAAASSSEYQYVDDMSIWECAGGTGGAGGGDASVDASPDSAAMDGSAEAAGGADSGAGEVCNFIDDNGDGQVDEGFDWVADPWTNNLALVKTDAVRVSTGRVAILTGGTGKVKVWLLTDAAQVLDGPMSLPFSLAETSGEYIAADDAGNIAVAYAGTDWGACTSCRLQLALLSTAGDHLAVVKQTIVSTSFQPVRHLYGLTWSAQAGFVAVADGTSQQRHALRIASDGQTVLVDHPLSPPVPFAALGYTSAAAGPQGLAWSSSASAPDAGAAPAVVGVLDSFLASDILPPIPVTAGSTTIDHDIQGVQWLDNDIVAAFMETPSYQPQAVRIDLGGTVVAGPVDVGPSNFAMLALDVNAPGVLILTAGRQYPYPMVLRRLSGGLQSVASPAGGKVELGSFPGTPAQYSAMTRAGDGVLVFNIAAQGATRIHCP